MLIVGVFVSPDHNPNWSTVFTHIYAFATVFTHHGSIHCLSEAPNKHMQTAQMCKGFSPPHLCFSGSYACLYGHAGDYQSYMRALKGKQGKKDVFSFKTYI